EKLSVRRLRQLATRRAGGPELSRPGHHVAELQRARDRSFVHLPLAISQVERAMAQPDKPLQRWRRAWRGFWSPSAHWSVRELWGHPMGEIDTKEKFDKHRMALAQNEWRQMKANDSRECRNCHAFTAIEKDKQRPRAQQRHAEAQQKGMTCIDCHKGIAHLLP